MKKTDYPALIAQAEGLIDGVPHLIANLANVSALIYTTLDELNWAGFYLAEGDKLVAIVSHVRELEDRIDNRIVVTGSNNGSHISINP